MAGRVVWLSPGGLTPAEPVPEPCCQDSMAEGEVVTDGGTALDRPANRQDVPAAPRWASCCSQIISSSTSSEISGSLGFPSMASKARNRTKIAKGISFREKLCDVFQSPLRSLYRRSTDALSIFCGCPSTVISFSHSAQANTFGPPSYATSLFASHSRGSNASPSSVRMLSAMAAAVRWMRSSEATSVSWLPW